jgi:hypothetical protein
MLPFRKKKDVEQYQHDIVTDILYVHTSEVNLVKWVPYNKHHVGNYARVHYDPTSDVMVLRIDAGKDLYTQATQKQWLMEQLGLTTTASKSSRLISLELTIPH